MELTINTVREMSFEDYIVSLSELIRQINKEEGFCDLQELLESLEKTDFLKYRYLLSVLIEQELGKLIKQSITAKDFNELIEESVLVAREVFQTIFKETCFTGEAIKWLPLECQSNALLYRFLTEGRKELKLLVEAAKLRPEIASLMKYWLTILSTR